MKYVIDIDLDNPVHNYGGTKTYVDETNGTMWGLSPAMRYKLRSFDNEIAAAEQRGANKAWSIARDSMSSEERKECLDRLRAKYEVEDATTNEDETAAQRRGIAKAWSLVQELDEITEQEWEEIFGDNSLSLKGKTYDEAKAKYEAWKQKREKFRVGDKVTNDEGSTAYVLVPDLNETGFVAFLKGYESPQCLLKKEWHKTGISSKSIKEFVRLAAKQIGEMDE